jgi:hypothetical protein
MYGADSGTCEQVPALTATTARAIQRVKDLDRTIIAAGEEAPAVVGERGRLLGRRARDALEAAVGADVEDDPVDARGALLEVPAGPKE